jgi:hypothetical protein
MPPSISTGGIAATVSSISQRKMHAGEIESAVELGHLGIAARRSPGNDVDAQVRQRGGMLAIGGGQRGEVMAGAIQMFGTLGNREPDKNGPGQEDRDHEQRGDPGAQPDAAQAAKDTLENRDCRQAASLRRSPALFCDLWRPCNPANAKPPRLMEI